MIYAFAAACLLGIAYYVPSSSPSHNKAIRYRRGIKYQLTETYEGKTSVEPDGGITTDWISLTTDGVITIQRGYCWDGPSGPTWDSRNFMRAALVHDALYQLLRMEKLGSNDLQREQYRALADIEMGRIQKEDGMNPLRRWVTNLGVNVFASFAAKPENRRRVFTAP